MRRIESECHIDRRQFEKCSLYGVLILSFVLSAAPHRVVAQTEGDYLYNVTMLRAAPGHFQDLIATLEESAIQNSAAGDAAPFWIRHSQGDQWDFMLIYPMGDYASYYSNERVTKRAAVWTGGTGRDLSDRLSGFTSYHEQWYARSVNLAEMKRRFEGMGMFHIEMFAGLPGKRAELIEQRRMENRFYEYLNRQQNILFIRDSGSNWDVMTIGFHKNLSAFAEAGGRFSEEQQDEAAKAAGFDGVNFISPYLRSLLNYHNDTIAVSVK